MSIANRELYAESLKRLNNLAEYRRLRVFSGNNTIPSVIWLVLLDRRADHYSRYTYFFGMKNIRAQYLHDSCADSNDNDDFGIDLYS